MTGTTYGIVAGYDGSPGAAQALRWAAREACARGTTLTVCLAWTPDHMDLPTESALCDLARQHGQEILTRGLPYAESVLGPGRVHPDLAAGSAAQALRERGVRVHYFGQLLGETLELPASRAMMHLDTVLTMLDRNTFVQYPYLEREPRSWTLTPNGDDRTVSVTRNHDLWETVAGVLGVDKVTVLSTDEDIMAAEREQWD